MKKKIIPEIILEERKVVNELTKPYTLGEIKSMLGDKGLELEDTDTIFCGHDEGYYDTDSAEKASYYVMIMRDREETDEEYSNRIKKAEKHQKELKERRYQRYLELKKEFGDDGGSATNFSIH